MLRRHAVYMAIQSVSLVALRAFEAVGRLGGIRRAAATLSVSHAIVSRHLQAIEAKAGTILFDREAGRLTTAGAAYHARISVAFAEISAATAGLIAARADRLVIGCAPGLASLWLSARLTHFGGVRDAPVVELHAFDNAPPLGGEGVDGDIRYCFDDAQTQSVRNIRQIELARPGVFPVTTPKLASTIRPRLATPADLTALPLIEEGDGRDWRLWLLKKGVTAPTTRIVASYGHAHLALAAARAGQGIALGNPFLLADDLATGRLVPLSAENGAFSPIPLGAYVLRAHAIRWANPAFTRFRRWLVREFASVTSSQATFTEPPSQPTWHGNASPRSD